MGDSFFRRNILLVALLHLVALGLMWFFSRNHSSPLADVQWLDGGSLGGGGGAAGEGADAPPPPHPP